MRTLTVFLLLSSLAFAGWKKDRYTAEFKRDAKLALELITSGKYTIPKQLKEIRLYELGLDIELAEIVFTKKKLKDKFGRVKAALNFPHAREIRVNMKHWEGIRHDNKVELRLPFVLHEYLGLSGQEVDHYNISTAILTPYKEYAKEQAAIKKAEDEKKAEQRAIQQEKWRKEQAEKAAKKAKKEKERLEKERIQREEAKAARLQNEEDIKSRAEVIKARDLDDRPYYGKFKMSDIIELLGLDFSYITSFSGRTYRNKTMEDNKNPNTTRDTVCSFLGFSFSNDYEETEVGANYHRNIKFYFYNDELYHHIDEGNVSDRTQIKTISCYHPVDKK